MKTILLIALVLSGCRKDYYDTRLEITNNSDTPIYVNISDFYKDTNYVYVNYNPGNAPEQYKIQPKETKSAIRPIGTWEKAFQEDDTIAFYFFDAEIIENSSWDSVRSNYLILKRSDYTLGDLINLHWTLIYP